MPYTSLPQISNQFSYSVCVLSGISSLKLSETRRYFCLVVLIRLPTQEYLFYRQYADFLLTTKPFYWYTFLLIFYIRGVKLIWSHELNQWCWASPWAGWTASGQPRGPDWASTCPPHQMLHPVHMVLTSGWGRCNMQHGSWVGQDRHLMQPELIACHVQSVGLLWTQEQHQGPNDGTMQAKSGLGIWYPFYICKLNSSAKHWMAVTRDQFKFRGCVMSFNTVLFDSSNVFMPCCPTPVFPTHPHTIIPLTAPCMVLPSTQPTPQPYLCWPRSPHSGTIPHPPPLPLLRPTALS